MTLDEIWPQFNLGKPIRRGEWEPNKTIMKCKLGLIGMDPKDYTIDDICICSGNYQQHKDMLLPPDKRVIQIYDLIATDWEAVDYD